MRSLLSTFCVSAPVLVDALTPVDSSMRSFGVAIKAGKCLKDKEVLLFEHNTTSTAASSVTHGVIQQQWHAGTHGDPRMRIYVDDEADAHASSSSSSMDSPAVDYLVSYAHGLSPHQDGVYPWQSQTAGHTHTMGWYNTWAIPFQRRVRVTMTCSQSSAFWYRVAGAENYPIAVGELSLPPHAKLNIEKLNVTVGIGALVTLANMTGTGGLLSQVAMYVSSTHAYQEGCVRARVDGRTMWLSSGLEDYFLGSYFHTMPQMSLPLTGFQLSNFTRCPTKNNGPNTLAAYRIHAPDPVLFGESLVLQWQPSGAPGGADCNGEWPQSDGQVPPPNSTGVPGVENEVTILTHSWVYTY